jgi:SAM-dependent methyltransferase
MALPDDLAEFHRQYNRNSEGLWAQFAEHRALLTGLAQDAGGQRLLVLGAGNCNDLDLPRLAGTYREIHLADLDQEALARARDRQPPEVQKALVLRAPVDLSGALEKLAEFRHERPTPAQIAALPGSIADNVSLELRGSYDTVMSTCLLSQLMHGTRRALGEHPDLEMVATALALGHLRAMVRLLRPGGHGILATDTCSSEMYPPLEDRWKKFSPLAVLGRLEETENLLSGTRPSMIFEALTNDVVIGPLLDKPQLLEPWLWRMGKLVLLVYGVVFKKHEN